MVGSVGRITLWGVEVFVATAEEASISAAARRLGSSAATVSQQLTNLESAIGATLLNRSERPITLTSAGELFLRRANAILNEADQARLELATANFGLSRLRLGMIEDLETDVTPRLLMGMSETLRSCQFLLETGASHRLHDLLEARALDVIVAADVGALGDGLEVHPLLIEPFVIAIPRGAKEVETLTHLPSSLPLIQYTTRHHMGQLIAAHLSRQNLTPAHRFELDSYHAIMAMVASGVGWTILTPLGCLRARRFLDRVQVLPLPGAQLSRTINLTARRGVLGTTPTDLARQLRDLLRDSIEIPAHAEYPWLNNSLKVI